MNRRLKRAPGARSPRRERGTMLIISLIVLVALTLAGIAAMRSVDTAAVMAGNIAMRQAALNAADQGIQAGFGMLNTPNGDLTRDGLNLNVPGYFSSAPTTDPDWSNPTTWQNAALLNGGTPDVSGNVVSFIVQRLCTVPNCATNDTCLGQTNVCGYTMSNVALSKEGQDNFRPQDAQITSVPQVHYRISARAVGPRNSVAIVQTMLR